MSQITLKTLHDGPKNAVVHVTVIGTGAGDVEDEVVLDPATFARPLKGEPLLTVERLSYSLIGFDARLEFDYLSSESFIWALKGGEYVHLDFGRFGGIKDPSGDDGTGKLQLTTMGLAEGQYGAIVVEAKKS